MGKIFREERDLRILHQLGMEGLVKPKAWDSSGSSGSEEEEEENKYQYQGEMGESVKNEMISPHLLVKTEMPEEAQLNIKSEPLGDMDYYPDQDFNYGEDLGDDFGGADYEEFHPDLEEEDDEKPL